jgi:hypothetical protein
MFISDKPVFQMRLTASSVGLPFKQSISKATNYNKPNPLQPGMEKIYTLTNCSVRKPSAPVFGGGEWNRYQAVYERTLVEILQHMIFRPKYYLKVQSTSLDIGAPTLQGPIHSKLNYAVKRCEKMLHEKLNWIFSGTAHVFHQVCQFFWSVLLNALRLCHRGVGNCGIPWVNCE